MSTYYSKVGSISTQVFGDMGAMRNVVYPLREYNYN